MDSRAGYSFFVYNNQNQPILKKRETKPAQAGWFWLNQSTSPTIENTA